MRIGFWQGKPKEGDQLEDFDIDRSIILKRTVKNIMKSRGLENLV
jgi:hypothetical protein